MLDVVGYRGVDCANKLTQVFNTGADLRNPQYNIEEIINYCVCSNNYRNYSI